jgi:NTE family protein
VRSIGGIRTAFVFAGGGSLGAIQVGMLKALHARGYRPDFVVGSSVGALNAAFFAGDPTAAGIARLEAIWRGLRRSDVFPTTALRGVIRLIRDHGYLVESTALERLISRHLTPEPLEARQMPCHVVATDLLEGIEVRISSGPCAQALLASAAIPGIFAPVEMGGRFLVDGSIANHSPIGAAVQLGARRLIVLPTGYSCTRDTPPRRAIGRALHAFNILIAGKLVNAVHRFGSEADIRVVPPLCPLDVSPFEFDRTGELIERAEAQTLAWLESGVELVDGVPHQLVPHTHDDAANPYGARTLATGNAAAGGR